MDLERDKVLIPLVRASPTPNKIQSISNVLQIPLCVQFGGNIIFRPPFAKRWLFIRLLLTFCMVVCFSLCIISYLLCCQFWQFFAYFTNHSLILSLVYFVLSSYVTIQIYIDIRRHRNTTSNETSYYSSWGLIQVIEESYNQKFNIDCSNNPNAKIIRAIDIKRRYNAFAIFMLNLSFKCCLSSEIFLSIAYWVSEFDPLMFFAQKNTLLDKLVTIITHGLICLLLLIDFSMSGYKLQFKDVVYPLALTVIVILWTIVFDFYKMRNLSNKEYLYSSFDWDEDIFTALRSSVIFMLGITAFHCLMVVTKKEALIHWNKSHQ